MVEMKTRRAGFTANGVPANINIVRSLQTRRPAALPCRAGKKRSLKELEQEYTELQAQKADPATLAHAGGAN